MNTFLYFLFHSHRSLQHTSLMFFAYSNSNPNNMICPIFARPHTCVHAFQDKSKIYTKLQRKYTTQYTTQHTTSVVPPNNRPPSGPSRWRSVSVCPAACAASSAVDSTTLGSQRCWCLQGGECICSRWCVLMVCRYYV